MVHPLFHSSFPLHSLVPLLAYPVLFSVHPISSTDYFLSLAHFPGRLPHHPHHVHRNLLPLSPSVGSDLAVPLFSTKSVLSRFPMTLSFSAFPSPLCFCTCLSGISSLSLCAVRFYVVSLLASSRSSVSFGSMSLRFHSF